MFILEKGIRLKYRPTGTVFELKKIAKQFVILNSMDGSTQIMSQKNNFIHCPDWEEVPPAETTDEDSAQDIPAVRGIRQGAGR
jgi:hypothetical protein